MFDAETGLWNFSPSSPSQRQVSSEDIKLFDICRGNEFFPKPTLAENCNCGVSKYEQFSYDYKDILMHEIVPVSRLTAILKIYLLFCYV